MRDLYMLSLSDILIGTKDSTFSALASQLLAGRHLSQLSAPSRWFGGGGGGSRIPSSPRMPTQLQLCVNQVPVKDELPSAKHYLFSPCDAAEPLLLDRAASDALQWRSKETFFGKIHTVNESWLCGLRGHKLDV